MDKYDLTFFFDAVLALCGAIILLASTITFSTWNLGAPLLSSAIIIMLGGIIGKIAISSQREKIKF